MATDTTESGRLLLEQEEQALATKRAAVKAAAAALDALRKNTDECRESFAALRALGFTHRDIVEAYSLTKGEAATLLPRRSRKGSDAAHTQAAEDPSEATNNES